MKRMFSVALLSLAGLPLSGCASMFTAITDRAMVAEKLPKKTDEHKVVAMSGDRRLVGFRKLTSSSEWMICAEPFAGATAGRKGISSIEVVTKAKGSDEFGESVLKVDERGPVDRLYQDAAHDLCIAREAGMLNDTGYIAALTNLQVQAFETLKATSSSGH